VIVAGAGTVGAAFLYFLRPARRHFCELCAEAAQVSYVKESVGGSVAHARTLAEIGKAAYDGLSELSSAATHQELRSHAVRLRAAAFHSLTCLSELTAGAAKVELFAALREAAHPDE
jgi:hypothetical protein